MEVFYDELQGKPSVVLGIGTFDGVHIGHQQLLAKVRDEAEKASCKSAVLTFDPHPRCVIDPTRCPSLITTVEERITRFTWHQIDVVWVKAFTEDFSRQSAQEFCDLLTRSVNLHAVVVGENFAFGHDREGTIDFLQQYARDHGITLHVVPLKTAAESDKPLEAVSSHHIRDLIKAGQVETAADLLGYPYFINGIVEHGDRLGEVLGFPTANLGFPNTKCVPGFGIYAGWIYVGGHWYPSAISVGVRPTFGGEDLRVEAYILDFHRDIYHHTVKLAFQSRIRDEVRFVERRSLIEQMKKDTDAVRKRLSDMPLPTLGA